MFDLSSSYYDDWFIIGLLRHNIVCHLIMVFYLCEDDSDKQKIVIVNILITI